MSDISSTVLESNSSSSHTYKAHLKEDGNRSHLHSEFHTRLRNIPHKEYRKKKYKIGTKTDMIREDFEEILRYFDKRSCQEIYEDCIHLVHEGEKTETRLPGRRTNYEFTTLRRDLLIRHWLFHMGVENHVVSAILQGNDSTAGSGEEHISTDASPRMSLPQGVLQNRTTVDAGGVVGLSRLERFHRFLDEGALGDRVGKHYTPQTKQGSVFWSENFTLAYETVFAEPLRHVATTSLSRLVTERLHLLRLRPRSTGRCGQSVLQATLDLIKLPSPLPSAAHLTAVEAVSPHFTTTFPDPAGNGLSEPPVTGDTESGNVSEAERCERQVAMNLLLLRSGDSSTGTCGTAGGIEGVCANNSGNGGDTGNAGADAGRIIGESGDSNDNASGSDGDGDGDGDGDDSVVGDNIIKKEFDSEDGTSEEVEVTLSTDNCEGNAMQSEGGTQIGGSNSVDEGSNIVGKDDSDVGDEEGSEDDDNDLLYTSAKMQVLESCVGRHFEGVTDALLEMVFRFSEPYVDILDSKAYSDESENEDNGEEDGEEDGKEGGKEDGKEDEDDGEEQTEELTEGRRGAGFIRNSTEDYLFRAFDPRQKRHFNGSSVPKGEDVIGGEEEEEEGSSQAEEKLRRRNMRRKRKREIEAEASMNWEHVLESAQAAGEESVLLTGSHSAEIHPLLPRLSLTPALLCRVRSRATALFSSSTKNITPVVPSSDKRNELLPQFPSSLLS